MPTYNDLDNITIGDENGLDGAICNVTYYKHSLTADQIALTKTFENLPALAENSCFDKKVCDWDLSPFSFFWAAKGYIKNTILWKIISKKVIFFSILKNYFNISNNKLLIDLTLFLDSGFNFLIYPFIVFRYKYYDYIFRLIRYILKRIYN